MWVERRGGGGKEERVIICKRIIRFYLFMASSFMQCVDDFMDILLYRSRIIVTKTLMKKRKEKESYI